MNFLLIYDVLVYYFKKDIAKIIYSFTYQIYDDEEQFEYDGTRIINNELYYYFKYLNPCWWYIPIIKKDGKLICSGSFQEQLFDKYIDYRDHYDGDRYICIDAYEYKQYVEDIIERESKNE